MTLPTITIASSADTRPILASGPVFTGLTVEPLPGEYFTAGDNQRWRVSAPCGCALVVGHATRRWLPNAWYSDNGAPCAAHPAVARVPVLYPAACAAVQALRAAETLLRSRR